jgi:hypothetical protein
MEHKFGIYDAEAIRELAVNLKRVGIDTAQCAKGARIFMIMKKLGINENQFESFIHEVDECCQRYGLISENIASNLLALIKLSKDIPLAKIPEYIEEKKNEITKLEKYFKTLKEKNETLEMETSEKEDLHDAALAKEKTTVAELKEYSNLKTELRKYGLSIVDDIPKFAQVVYEVKQYENDVDKILSDYYSDIHIKEVKRNLFSNQVRELEDKKNEP